MELIWIILATLIISSLSLVGIFILFLNEKFLHRILLILVALSAGAMLGTSLFHLLPEALEIHEAAGYEYFFTALILLGGFLLFFILEQFLAWHHCHSASHHGEHIGFHCHKEIKPVSKLVLYSDFVHNFIDGLVIATSFIISPALGVATSVAVALHEIPQEVGDYGVLVYGGYKKRKALLLNYISATSVILGGVVGYFLSTFSGGAVLFLIPFAAGSFLYIAATDLLPEIKHTEKPIDTITHFMAFAVGLGLIILMA